MAFWHEVLTAVKISNMPFWSVRPCGVLGGYQRLGGTHFTLNMEAIHPSETLLTTFCVKIRKRRCILCHWLCQFKAGVKQRFETTKQDAADEQQWQWQSFTHDERQDSIWLCGLYWSDVTAPRWHGEDRQWEAGPRAVIQPSRDQRRHGGSRSFPPSVPAPNNPPPSWTHLKPKQGQKPARHKLLLNLFAEIRIA